MKRQRDAMEKSSAAPASHVCCYRTVVLHAVSRPSGSCASAGAQGAEPYDRRQVARGGRGSSPVRRGTARLRLQAGIIRMAAR
jgi:hypothetical protein